MANISRVSWPDVNNDGAPKAEQVLTLLSIGDINYGSRISWPQNLFTLHTPHANNNSRRSLALYALVLAL